MNHLKVYVIVLAFGMVAVNVKAQLAADFGPAVTAGCIPLVIQFSDESTYNGSPLIYFSTANGDVFNSHQWIFGCTNNISNVQNPVYGFFAPGPCCITLVVTADGITFDSVSKCITVYPQPVVSLAADQYSGCSPLTVCFTDSSSTTSGNIVSWVWDFCDGVIDTVQHPCHTFNYGCYCVNLQVTDSLGCWASKTFPNLICTSNPEADFSSPLNENCASDTFTFDDLSTAPAGDTIISWHWDFGDGSDTIYNIFASSVAHVYNTPGEYTVLLEVHNVYGCPSVMIKDSFVTITEAQVPVITQTGSLLEATEGASYQWYLDGAPLAGAESQTWTALQDGDYFVMVADSNGCSASSDTLTVILNPQNLTACDSLTVNCCGTDSISANFITLEATNASSFLFSYPGFILFDANTDTIARENVNYYGIGTFPQQHRLQLVSQLNLPFTGYLELHSDFYNSLDCTIPVHISGTIVTRHELKGFASLSVFPNPAANMVTIDMGGEPRGQRWTVKLLNSLGAEVYSEAIESFPLRIWLEASARGIYSLTIMDEQGERMSSEKLIVW